MKGKLLIVTLIAVLLFSTLNVVPAQVQCPRCHGTGKITTSKTCPTCGGSGRSTAIITLKRTSAGGTNSRGVGVTYVSGVFQNEGSVGAYGTATASVKTSSTQTYTNSSARTYFPPHEDITVTVIFGEVAYEPYYACIISMSGGDETVCPDCDGTGFVSVTIDCPDCGGTGYVAASAGDITNFQGVGGVIVGAAVVAAVVIAAVVVVRRRRVSEGSLRKLSLSEFQDWVVQGRFLGRASSTKDSYMGIDGYTAEGYPIQVKQSDDVARNVVDSFATAMGRSKAKNGVIVAFSFGQGAYEGVVRAKLHYGIEIKTVTVKELLESGSRAL
jgi:hypothetical protein